MFLISLSLCSVSGVCPLMTVVYCIVSSWVGRAGAVFLVLLFLAGVCVIVCCCELVVVTVRIVFGLVSVWSCLILPVYCPDSYSAFYTWL